MDADPGSEIFLALDPGWKYSDPVSGINIPDMQHLTLKKVLLHLSSETGIGTRKL